MDKKPTYEELEQRVKELERDSIVHRQIEEALSESEDNFRGLYEGSRDAIGHSDMDGRLLETNKAFQELTGYSAQELSKMTYQDLTPKKWHKIEAEVVKESVDKKYLPLLEKEYRRKDGTIVPIELSGFTSKTEEGRSVSMWAFIRDISDRKKTADELKKLQDHLEELVKERTAELSKVNEHRKLEIEERKQAEEALAEAQQVANIGSWEWNIVDNKRIWSDEFYRILGFEPQAFEASFEKFMACIHPEDMEYMKEVEKEFIEGNKSSLTLEHRLVQPDGTERFILGQMRSQHDKEGRPAKMMGTMLDITERKQAEDALRESEATARAILNTPIDAMGLIDTSGIILDINETMARSLGGSVNELIGLFGWDLLPPELAQSRKAIADRVIQSGKPIRFEDERQGIYFDNVFYPVFDAQGEATKIAVMARDITERVQAEEALRESEERYRTILENMVDGYYEVDLAGNLTFFNDSLCNMTGYTRDELMGMNNREYMNEEAAKRVYQVFNGVYETGKPVKMFEYQIILQKNGSKRDVESSVALIKDAEGQPIGFRGVLRDVTERKQAEKAIELSKKEWETTFDAISDWISLIDVEYQIQKSNRAGEEILGLPLDEIIGHRICKLLHGSDSPLPGCAITKMLKTKKRESVELQISNGRWIMVSVDPVIGDDKEVAAAVHIVRDITDRKQGEQALQETKADLDKAQSVAHIGSWSRDLKTDQGHWSDEMYRALGLTPGSPEHPTHEDFLSRVHPDDWDHIESMIKRAIEEKESFEYEFRTVPINGSERIIHSRGEVECDDAGVPVRRFGINQDVTETRKLQAQVQESQKTQAIVTLAGGIAHNFNNALTPIIGNIDILEMAHGQDESTMECLKDMKTSGLRMARLTSQMLAYAEGGKYNPQVLSLSDVVDATLPLIQHTFDPSVRVETDLPLDVKDMEADSTQMQMVLSAIMANSNEAIEGPGRIRISTRNMDLDQGLIKDYPGLKPGPHVCLSIEDDGKGMDEETRNRIFDPFFTTHFMGRGLGMASVYGIVRNHDGAITVDSELGKGTVVRIYLPAMEAEEKPKKTVVSKPEIELPTGDATILVIEDEEDVMMLFRQVLERLGYRVLQAETGKKAIRLAETFDGQIDLAILDIKLPDMTGDKVYPLIMEARPDLKVVVCSGYTIEGPPQDVLDAGAEGFVQKPFHIATLAEKLKEVLEGK